MNRRRCLLSAVGLLCVASSLTVTAPRLPGARPVVEAAGYLSLQAALDAVPRTGGMVRLPPGKFVITEPLVIRREGFRLEGAGTVTHIRNAGTNGQSALVIRSEVFDFKKTRNASRSGAGYFPMSATPATRSPATASRRCG